MKFGFNASFPQELLVQHALISQHVQTGNLEDSRRKIGVRREEERRGLDVSRIVLKAILYISQAETIRKLKPSYGCVGR